MLRALLTSVQRLRHLSGIFRIDMLIWVQRSDISLISNNDRSYIMLLVPLFDQMLRYSSVQLHFEINDVRVCAKLAQWSA
jgi:hypothetical protein